MTDHDTHPATALFGAIDAGGTTFKCLLADAGRNILAEHRVATGRPDETVLACVDFLQNALPPGRRLQATGIASFGPIDIDPDSPDRGRIGNTPKPGWSGFNLRRAFATGLGCPAVTETDVNGALLAECAWGAAAGTRRAAYITVGTGIGVAAIQDGILTGSPLHPELGHLPVARPADDRERPGLCPFHGDCLEGLASAPAIWDSFGDPASLDAAAPGTSTTAGYIAQLCAVLSYTFRPERIVLGGGVMQNAAILHAIEAQYRHRLAGYVEASDIVPAGLGQRAGVWGAYFLATRQH